jgi:hypothetical protein
MKNSYYYIYSGIKTEHDAFEVLLSSSTSNLPAWTLQALAALQARFESCTFGVPTDDEAMWFLRDRGFDVEEAYNKLRTCLQWRHEFGVEHVSSKSIQREAATGKVYLHEHFDVYNRPALIIRVNKCASASALCGWCALPTHKQLAQLLILSLLPARGTNWAFSCLKPITGAVCWQVSIPEVEHPTRCHTGAISKLMVRNVRSPLSRSQH